MKLANPLIYPLSILVSGVVLVIGVRFVRLPNVVILPTAALVATAGATFLKSREPDEDKQAKQQLQKEIQMLQNAAKTLAEKSGNLRQEAKQLLTDDSFKIELLVIVEEACDRAIELPTKIDRLSQRIQGHNSLLSPTELQQQLLDVQNRLNTSSGASHQHLEQLANSLKRNIELAKAGEDTRQAQLVNLYTLIQETGGILQSLQNKLRTSDLSKFEEINELRSLSTELNNCQENMEILVGQ
jgi:DNA repair exonuclease SbcCD ATPase subunit